MSKDLPIIKFKTKIEDYPPKAFALQYHDEPVRRNSASGALFPAFASHFINTLGGYVCGCVLDENLTAKHIVSNQWHDVVRMQDSKYVQSDMGLCISEIMKLLRIDSMFYSAVLHAKLMVYYQHLNTNI